MTDETTLPPDDQAPPPSETPPTPDTPTTGEPASTPEPGTTTPETPPPAARSKAPRASTRTGKAKTPAKSKPSAKGKATPSPRPPQSSRCLARTMATDDAGTATECACELASRHHGPHAGAVITEKGRVIIPWYEGQTEPVRVPGTLPPRTDAPATEAAPKRRPGGRGKQRDAKTATPPPSAPATVIPLHPGAKATPRPPKGGKPRISDVFEGALAEGTAGAPPPPSAPAPGEVVPGIPDGASSWAELIRRIPRNTSRQADNPHLRSGRASKLELHPEIADIIYGYIKLGTPIRYACALSGLIDEGTYQSWISRAETGRNEDTGTELLPEDVARYRVFALAMSRARGEKVAWALNHLRKAAETPSLVTGQYDTRPLTWLLERTEPEAFRPPTTRTELTGKDGGPVTVATWEDVVISAREVDRGSEPVRSPAVVASQVAEGPATVALAPGSSPEVAPSEEADEVTEDAPEVPETPAEPPPEDVW